MNAKPNALAPSHAGRVELELIAWAVHVYRRGMYERTISELLPSRKMAESFCATFNVLHGGDECQAVATRVSILMDPPRHI